MRRIVHILFVLSVIAFAGCASRPSHDGYRSVPTQQSAPIKQERNRIVSVARAMLGTPYRYGGNSPTGFDCSGLVEYTYRQAGLNPPRTTLAQYRQSRPVAIKHLQPGDLLFFKLTGAKTSHVGIYVGRGKFIHAPSSGKVVSRSTLDNPYWQQHLIGAGTFL